MEYLAITFTNKAATEMREREQKLLGPAAENIWMSTFHALCVRILRRDADKIGYSHNFSIADSAEQLTLVKHIEKDLNINPKMYDPRGVLAAISNGKNDLLDPEAFETTASSPLKDGGQDLQGIPKKIAQRSNHGLWRFDHADLGLFKKIQKRCIITKTSSAIFWLTNTRILTKHNTNCVMLWLPNIRISALLGMLISQFTAGVALIWKHHELWAWLPKDGVRTVKLEQNYRSTGHILSAANSVIKNNQNRKDKNLWTDQGEGQKVTYYQAQSGDDEAHYIISKIQEEVKDKHRSYKNFAILYRTNAQSRTVEEAFVKSNIPYQIVGGHKFYDRKEIKDIMAYLKLVANPADTMSMNRIINTPKRGIGAATVDKLLTFADDNHYTV